MRIGVEKPALRAFEDISLEVTYYFPTAALFAGVTSAVLDVVLPRNALVDQLQVRVQARRVDSVQVQQVAQVRSYVQSGGHELVIDFGTPRTVSGVSLPAAQVTAVHAWLGSQFNIQSALAFGATASSSVSFPELRTERLRVRTSAALSDAQLAEVFLHLPEPPSGLALSIDGAAPVWTHPEPVQPRAGVAAPDAAGWDKESRRIVDLTAAFAALAGDPLAGDGPVTFKLVLSTAVPCLLNLALSGTPAMRRIRRVRFGSETRTALDFASEGLVDLPLALPAPPTGATRLIQELRWTAEADLPPARTVPPTGPDAVPGEDGLPLAQAVLTPEIAACVRLPAGTGVQTLQGVRLPLLAEGDGAEVRVVLWQPTEPAAGGLPLQPLPQGTSDPVTLAGAAAESWVGFTFSKPPVLETALAAAMPWLAVVVTRGSVGWGLATASGDATAAVDQMLLRRGPPNGPWKSLPAPLQSSTAVLNARGRLRLTGLAPKDAALAPLTVQLLGAAAVRDLNPVPKGEAATLVLGAGISANAPTLRLISRAVGRLTLRDVDVVSDL